MTNNIRNNAKHLRVWAVIIFVIFGVVGLGATWFITLPLGLVSGAMIVPVGIFTFTPCFLIGAFLYELIDAKANKLELMADFYDEYFEED